MSRSASASSWFEVPAWGTHTPPEPQGREYLAVEMCDAGLRKLEAGFAQLMWTFQKSR